MSDILTARAITPVAPAPIAALLTCRQLAELADALRADLHRDRAALHRILAAPAHRLDRDTARHGLHLRHRITLAEANLAELTARR